MFLGSSHDHLVPSVEQARLMASSVPRGGYQVLEGYGHICLVNHDLDLLRYVGPWCERVGLAVGSASTSATRARAVPHCGSDE